MLIWVALLFLAILETPCPMVRTDENASKDPHARCGMRAGDMRMGSLCRGGRRACGCPPSAAPV
ncbi:hypothetical protein BURPSS13_A0062 [Burkholderia pseudomallei S13]|nr:hypothetical protein BURPSS13_A0062 [Burkholderia pseudomallei S13]